MTELEKAQQQLLEIQTKIDKLVKQENNKKPYLYSSDKEL